MQWGAIESAAQIVICCSFTFLSDAGKCESSKSREIFWLKFKSVGTDVIEEVWLRNLLKLWLLSENKTGSWRENKEMSIPPVKVRVLLSSRSRRRSISSLDTAKI